jgi:putative sugar O-methyltransferase
MILLKDQKKITEAEFEVAKEQWKKAQLLCQQKDTNHFLSDYGSIWNKKAADISEAFKELSIDRLNQLRLSTGCFTNFSLADCKYDPNLPAIYDIVDEEEFDLEYKSSYASKMAEIKRFLPQTTHPLPAQYDAIFPIKFGEIGDKRNDKIINPDTINFQYIFENIYGIRLLNWLKKKKNPTIVELGGGHGALAYLFKKALPHVNYIIVDIPESFYFSMIYLSIVSQSNFEFYPHYEIERLSSRKVDLLINVGSIAQLPKQHIEFYFKIMTKMIGNHGLFFECNNNLSFNKDYEGCCLKPDMFLGRYFNYSRYIVNVPLKGRANLRYNNVSILKELT